MNIQGWLPLGLTGLISLLSKGLSKVLCPWDSSGTHSRAGSHSLLQGIFLSQGSNWFPTLQADSLPSELLRKPSTFHQLSSLHMVMFIFPCCSRVLELQLQHQFFQWIVRVDFLYDWLVWSPCCPRNSQESSPAPQFKRINSSVSAFFIVTHARIFIFWFFSHIGYHRILSRVPCVI